VSRSSALSSSRLKRAGEAAIDLAMAVSARLLPVAATLVVLAGLQCAAVSCTPEPAPYAARAAVERSPNR
jgi:hypothetical protein